MAAPKRGCAFRPAAENPRRSRPRVASFGDLPGGASLLDYQIAFPVRRDVLYGWVNMTFGDEEAARVRMDVLVEDDGHLDRVAALHLRAFAPEPQHLRGLTGPLTALERFVRFPEECLVAGDPPLRLLRHDAIVSRGAVQLARLQRLRWVAP